MDIDYLSADRSPPGEQKIGWRLFGLIVVSGFAGLVFWCAEDFLLLRFAPSRMTDYDGCSILFYFAAVFTASMIAFRNVSLRPRIGWSIFVVVTTTIVAGGLVVFIGIPIHFAMGGHI